MEINLADKYSYRVEWSEEDKCFIARCLELPSLGANGKTKEKALNEIFNVVSETINWMQEENKN